MARIGAAIPLETLSILEQREFIQELEGLGYSDLWSSEAQDIDGFTPLVLASQWAPSMRLGCAVFPVQTRGPALLAMSVAGICQAAPGRFTMGIGSSSSFIVEDWNGIPFRKPYQHTRDTARFLREVLKGEMVDHDYETFSVHNFRLNRAVPEQPPILIGALRQGMLELAGRAGDGAILNWIGAEDIAKAASFVKKYGDDKEIAARVVVCPTEDAERVRNIARYYVTGYLTVPTYRAQQEWLGRGPLLQPMWDRWEAGDRKGALSIVPDEVLDTFYIHGPPEKVRDRLREFLDAGVDTLIVAVLEAGMDPRDAYRLVAPSTW